MRFDELPDGQCFSIHNDPDVAFFKSGTSALLVKKYNPIKKITVTIPPSRKVKKIEVPEWCPQS